MDSKQFYTIDPLFDFQCLCDIDFGLYRLIKQDYYDKSIFDNDLFDSNDERFIRTMLLSRDKFNPLFIFCKPGELSNENLDNLYQQFLDEEYDKILELSPPTSIMSIASTANRVNKVVDVTVLCKDKREINWLTKYNHKLKYIESDYKDFDLKKYDTIYLKDIYTLNLLKQKSIKEKNIILSRFMFNLETEYSKMEMPIIEVAEKYYLENKFMLVDPYKGINVPVSEMV